MLVFVIPLKSTRVADSWTLTCRLLERTLRSICQQRSQEFEIIVVGNEQPRIAFDHPRIHYVTVDLPLPGAGHKNKDLDRVKKVLTGFYHAKRFDADYVMAMDADDLVHRDLSTYVASRREGNGWYVKSGYVYEEDRRFIYWRRSGFERWCGSSHIFNYHRHPMPVAPDDYRESLIEYYKNHRDILATTTREGRSLNPLPFPAVTYTVGNGENIYQKNFAMVHHANRRNWLFKLKDLRNYRWLRRSHRDTYGLINLEELHIRLEDKAKQRQLSV